MKKAILFAIAALSVGMAQAISASWTAAGTGTGTFNNTGFNTASTFDNLNSFSVAAIFTVTDLTTFKNNSAELLKIAKQQDNPDQNAGNYVGPVFGIHQNGTLSGKVANGVCYGPTHSDVSVSMDGLVVGTNNVVLTVDVSQYGTSTTTATYKLFINGSQVDGSWEHLNIGSGAHSYPYLCAVNGATLYSMSGIASAEDIASLPEPTALALLALGVAGLALKRKVA